MTYDATLVANNVLYRANRSEPRVTVTPMKLQKVLYFVASEYAKKTGRSLFSEHFQTWEYGPVLQSVYREFKPFSKSAIDAYAKDAAGRAYMADESDDPDLGQALDRVWGAAKGHTATALSRITHAENSAWDKAYQGNKAFLDDDDVKEDRTYYPALFPAETAGGTL